MASKEVSGVAAKLGQATEMGKSAALGAEHWVQQQHSAQKQMQIQSDSLAHLSQTVKGLEQQVKAMARVLTTQNVPKLSDNLKTGLEELRKELQHEMNEKVREVTARVDKELADLANKKGGIVKRVDDLEEKIMSRVNLRAEEQNKARYDMAEKIDELDEKMGQFMPQFTAQIQKVSQNLESKFNEIKKQFKDLEASNDETNQQQDEMLQTLETEAKKNYELAREQFADEGNRLNKALRRHESHFEEKIRVLHEALDIEQRDRNDMCKAVLNQALEKLNVTKKDVERAFHMHETDLEGQVRSVASGIGELKKGIEAEKTLREAADQELSRALAQERKDRDVDDERLLAMIQSCMGTLSKMHKTANPSA
eukprot:TRINITY_DN21453_c0_g1_i1.p2 TRINITY_DN21453_c0_g1~~TRINITY_DN21453_c0_g1_i1.p2  ORF type:complete len:401 (+),score=144.32 TRINITY_DN21453_c0_g1_i1:101-1204(+)